MEAPIIQKCVKIVSKVSKMSGRIIHIKDLVTLENYSQGPYYKSGGELRFSALITQLIVVCSLLPPLHYNKALACTLQKLGQMYTI